MWRRRVLVGFVAAATVAALMLTMQPWRGGAATTLGVTAKDTAIAQIPGMTRVSVFGTAAMGTCNESIGPGGHYPSYCSELKTLAGRHEEWILTSAYEQGFRWNAPVPLAAAHPGPVVVSDDWARFASPRDAARYMSEPDLVGTCSKPAPAVNGGIACYGESFLAQTGTQMRRVKQRELGQTGRSISYTWTSGATVVSVNVTGVGLTDAEAQQIALLARPS